MMYVELRAQKIPKPNCFNYEYDISTFINGKFKDNLGIYNLSGDKLIRTQRINQSQNFPFVPKSWIDRWCY
jgi:hypothetical protein